MIGAKYKKRIRFGVERRGEMVAVEDEDTLFRMWRRRAYGRLNWAPKS
jgi:hypothetical protein